ncbi:hypothetical protein DVH24_015868 [Malus domestica]|uniref:mRNA cap-binding protein n=1 Tax=Malus domestica TaxID=3750 RepID=A0A498JKE0_MALDO|nr:hypothetical protein DVH24_015868 [Malus domestica]
MAHGVLAVAMPILDPSLDPWKFLFKMDGDNFHKSTTRLKFTKKVKMLSEMGQTATGKEGPCCMGVSSRDNTKANAKPREDDDEPEEGEIVGNQDSASSKPSKGIAPQSHALEHSWTFWFNSPAAKSAKSKQEDWGSSIGPIYTFITIEEFWRTLAGRRKKPRTHRRALREEEEAGLSKSHGLGSASLRTFKEASSPHESPLVPLNLVPSPIKHGTVVQSSPLPPTKVKQTPPKGISPYK